MKERNPTDNLHTVLRGILFIALAFGLTFYTHYQLRNFLAGPNIAFESPKSGSTTTDSVITVKGIAERIAFIRLNGRQIFVDENGEFKEKLPLLPGHNIMELQATDRFGRVATEQLFLTYKKQ